MPRLLLVDDNPSIHRIAESLLAHTEVEVVCVGSGAEALARLGAGERFDAALVDTCMPGMDGWTLLDRLRAQESSAHLPVALMAGVLDTLDPAQLAQAPAQGFLKKPIELRDLADRVRALIAKPVSDGAPAAQAEAEEELLVLTEEDLLPEADLPRDPSLDLEELDLSVLDGLTGSLPPLEEAELEAAETSLEPEPAETGLEAAETWLELEPAEDVAAVAEEEPEAAAAPESPAEDSAAPAFAEEAAGPSDGGRLADLLADAGFQAALGRAVLGRLDEAVLRDLVREALGDQARQAQGPTPEAP